MKFFRFLKYFLCITFSFLVLSSPVFAGANVAVKGEGDEVPSYVRSNITGFDFHGEDLHLSSIAGAVARDADFSDVDLHGTTLTLSDLNGSIVLNQAIRDKGGTVESEFKVTNSKDNKKLLDCITKLEPRFKIYSVK